MAILADLSLRLSTNIAELKTGLEQAKASLNNFKSQTSKAGQEISKSFKEAGSNLSSSINMMTQGLSGLLQTGIGVFKGLITSVKGFATAFAATGIGAIIIAISVALAGLIAYFKKTGEGEDKLAIATAYLKGIFEGIIDVLVNVGKWLIKAFSDPKQAIIDLWNVIKENLVNRFQGLVDLFVSGWGIIKNGAIGVGLAIKGIFDEEARKKSSEFFQKMTEDLVKFGVAAAQVSTGITGEGWASFGKGIKDAANASAQLEKDQDAFDEKRRKVAEQNATLNAKKNAELVKANEEDVKSLAGKEARLKAINTAIEYQKQITANNLDIAKGELGLLLQKISIEGDLKDMTDAQADAVSALKVAYINAGAEGDAAIKALTKQQTNLTNAIILSKRELETPLAGGAIKPIEAGPLKNPALEQATSDAATMDKMNKDLAANRVKYEKEAADYIAAFDKKQREERLQATTTGLQIAQDAVSALQNFQMAAMNRELAAAGNNESKKEEIRKKYAKKQKATAIAQAAISTALAVVNAIATAPNIILGFVLAGVAAAVGAAQIGVIQSTPLKEGGLAYGQTLATVGDYPSARRNPEVIAPLSRLKELIKPQTNVLTGDVEFRISGYELVGLLNKQEKLNLTF